MTKRINPYLINQQISQGIKRLSKKDRLLFSQVIFQFLADSEAYTSLFLHDKYMPLIVREDD